jgi:hypothetical protein
MHGARPARVDEQRSLAVGRPPPTRTSMLPPPHRQERTTAGVRKAFSKADDVLERGEASLLDLVDNLLNRGVLIQGEVVLGVARVDLVYLRLQLILCAADRILPKRRTP